ncbi:MAG: glucose dehydrogenase [Actinobacteria bacterium HGW-Actinobacteria-1]|nr:MAG: glucose dehydrogenase [Actinobacteria bacterium HGW-Actinobacteria-1]
MALLLIGCKPTSTPVVVTPRPTTTVEPTAPAEPQPTPLGDMSVDFELVTDGLSQPLLVTGAGDDSGRLFVVEKSGLVWIIRDGIRSTQPFLDISGAVSTNSERGLLGLAFSQSFAEDNLFYVDYTDKDGTTTISRMTASGDSAVSGSEQVLLKIKQPYANHNGGMLAFGPDGDLYVATGDGGSGGDPNGNGQNTSVLLGKLLRIDVARDNTAVRDTEYGIPPDNPFANTPGASREIWAYGLRNPWRFSFDRMTGDLWIGDVGQDAWEEIDFQPADSVGGENYGWNAYEGTHTYPPGAKAPKGDFALPVVEYDHKAGESVTGGYVYRGTTEPMLWGTYFYGDYVSGRVWGLQRTALGFETRELADTAYNVVSFGEDDAGELYMVDFGGAIYRVVAK